MRWRRNYDDSLKESELRSFKWAIQDARKAAERLAPGSTLFHSKWKLKGEQGVLIVATGKSYEELEKWLETRQKVKEFGEF
jgi:hypothetical protein